MDRPEWKRWSESSGWMLLGRLTRTVAGLALFASLARLLSTENMGKWLLFMGIWGTFEMLRDGASTSGFLRFASGTSEKVHSRYGAALAWLLVVWTMLLLALALGIDALASLWSDEWRELTGSAPILILASGPATWALVHLQSVKNFRAMCGFRIAHAMTLMLGVTRFLSAQEPPHLGQVLVLLAAANGLGTLAVWPSLGRPTFRGPGTVQAEMAQLFHHGTFAAASRVGSAIHRSADLWLVATLATPAAVALYGCAWKLADTVEILLQPLIKVVVPEVSAAARRDHAAASRLSANVVVLLTVPTVAISAVLFWAPGTCLTLLAGPEYAQAAPVLRVLAVFNLLRPADRVMGVLLDALGHPELNAQKVATSVAINLGLTAVLLDQGGSWALQGAAVASVLAALVALAMGDWYIRRHTRRPLSGWVMNSTQTWAERIGARMTP